VDPTLVEKRYAEHNDKAALGALCTLSS